MDTKLIMSALEAIYLIYTFHFMNTSIDFNILASPEHYLMKHAIGAEKNIKDLPLRSDRHHPLDHAPPVKKLYGHSPPIYCECCCCRYGTFIGKPECPNLPDSNSDYRDLVLQLASEH